MLKLDHVQTAMPAGREDEARAFFGGLLGLTELEKPVSLTGRGGCWFALGDRQLHLGVETPFTPARKAHVAFITDSLDTIRMKLADAGCSIIEDAPIDGRERFFTEDPFGNRIEVLQHGSSA